MNQLDWVGTPPLGQAQFRDIRNTRPSAAEEKAVLAKDLGELAQRIPKVCGSWSVNRTRDFVAAQTKARKVAANPRSTVPDLTAALTNLKRYWVDA